MLIVDLVAINEPDNLPKSVKLPQIKGKASLIFQVTTNFFEVISMLREG